jgi:uncharacterized membrane protein YgcG
MNLFLYYKEEEVMNQNDLHFNIGNKIEVNSKEYTVKGSILFSDKTNNSNWTEYKLKSSKNGEIKWLSIDLAYKEYALYEQLPFYEKFDEDSIKARGYHEVDAGIARVSQASGDVDVVSGDIVNYKEFEDLSEENIISIENWEDEQEYSKGYYLESYKIKKIHSANHTYSTDTAYSTSHYNDYSKKKIRIAVASIVTLILIFLGISSLAKANNKHLIEKFLASNSKFQYSTSITSDLDTTQKADVYSTSLSVEETAKAILEKIGKKVTEVQENKEDASVGILTDYEYCFVYTSEDSSTLIQISSRLYAYSSNNKPYHSHITTSNYYRRYYYSTAYSKDKTTYRNNMNAYTNYTTDSINIDPNDKYKSYSNTIRQSSISSRSSSGGGTSSGK